MFRYSLKHAKSEMKYILIKCSAQKCMLNKIPCKNNACNYHGDLALHEDSRHPDVALASRALWEESDFKQTMITPPPSMITTLIAIMKYL